MRFRLRTLLIVAAVGPPLLAGLWWAWTAVGTLLPVILIFALPPFLFFIVPELGPLIRWMFKD